MRVLVAQYPRYGYRRIRIFLAREGYSMSVDRCYRLWCKARLQVPRKRPRKRLATSRPRPLAPSLRNQVWAYDFVFDACANGQKLKCLTVIDEYTRECLAIDVAGSIRSVRVIELLSRLVSRLVSQNGAPQIIRSDNGPEFVSPPSCNRSPTPGSIPHTSTPASPGRMVRTRVSTANYAMNGCRWNGFAPERRRVSSSKHGVATTTPSGRIPALATGRHMSTRLP